MTVAIVTRQRFIRLVNSPDFGDRGWPKPGIDISYNSCFWLASKKACQYKKAGCKFTSTVNIYFQIRLLQFFHGSKPWKIGALKFLDLSKIRISQKTGPFWLLQSPWFLWGIYSRLQKMAGELFQGRFPDGAFQFRKSENWKVSFSSLVFCWFKNKMGDCNLVLDVTIILKITFFFSSRCTFCCKIGPPTFRGSESDSTPEMKRRSAEKGYPTSSACEHDWLARKPTTVLLKGHLEDLAFCPSK